jgi:hypothetical protein
MEEIFEVLLLLLLNILAPILTVAGVIWGFFIARGLARTRKSLAEAQGDPIATRLEKTRLASRLIGFLATLLFVAGLARAFFFFGSEDSFLGLENSDHAPYAAIGAVVLSGAGWIWAALIRSRYNALFKKHFVAAEPKFFYPLGLCQRRRPDNRPIQGYPLRPARSAGAGGVYCHCEG